jgi:hypothetical protein
MKCVVVCVLTRTLRILVFHCRRGCWKAQADVPYFPDLRLGQRKSMDLQLSVSVVFRSQAIRIHNCLGVVVTIKE